MARFGRSFPVPRRQRPEVFPPPSPPTAPAGLAVTAEASAEVDLSWSASSGATGYKIYRDGALVRTQAGTTWADTTLRNGRSYAYQVTAYNGSGESARSSVVYGVPSGTVQSLGQLAPNEIRAVSQQTLSGGIASVQATISMANYSAEALDRDPLLYLRLRETTGTTAADAASHGLGAATAANVTLNTVATPLSGDAGKAYGFNGTNATVSKAIDLSGVSKLTLSFWLYMNAYTSTTDQYAVTLGAAGDIGSLWVQPDYAGSTVSIGFGDPTNGYAFADFARPSAGAWHLWGVELDHTTASVGLYIDGVRQTPVSSGTSPTASSIPGGFANNSLYLMANGGSSGWAAGSMAEFALLDNLLTDDEHARIYQQGTIAQASAAVRAVAYDAAGNLLGTGDEITVPAGQRNTPVTFTFSSAPVASGVTQIGLYGGTGASGAYVVRTHGDATDGVKQGGLTYPTAPSTLAPTRSVYHGAWITYVDYDTPGTPGYADDAPWDMASVTHFESATGKGISLITFGQDITTNAFDPVAVNNIWNHGSIPIIAASTGPTYTNAQILSGAADTAIRAWAQAAALWGKPIFLRFNWEGNGDWFQWAGGNSAVGNTPTSYINTWRRVYRIFQEMGATNVNFAWVVNIDTNSVLPVSISSIYPGDAYVDWVGFDGYNQGNQSVATTYDAAYATLVALAPNKPLLVGETSSTTTSTTPTKAQWITDLFSRLPTNYPQIRAMSWFESFVDDNYTIATTTAGTGVATAYSAGIAATRYIAPSTVIPQRTRAIPTPGDADGYHYSYTATLAAPTTTKSGGASAAAQGGGAKAIIIAKSGGASANSVAGGSKLVRPAKDGGALAAGAGGASKLTRPVKAGGGALAGIGGATKLLGKAATGGAAAAGIGGASKVAAKAAFGGATLSGVGGGDQGASLLRTKDGGALASGIGGAAKLVRKVASGGGVAAGGVIPNLFTNDPSFESGSAALAVANGTVTRAIQSDGGYDGTYYVRVNTSGAVSDGIAFPSANVPVAAGAPIVLSAWVRGTAGTALRLHRREADASNVFLREPVSTPTAIAQTGVWQRIVWATTMSVDAVGLRLKVTQQNAAQGAITFDVDAMMASYGTVPGPFNFGALPGMGSETIAVVKSGGAQAAGVGGASKLVRSVKAGGALMAGVAGGAAMRTQAKAGGAMSSGIGGASKLVLSVKAGGGFATCIGGGTKALGAITKAGGALAAGVGGAVKLVRATKAGGALAALVGGGDLTRRAVKIGGASLVGVGGGAKALGPISKAGGGSIAGVSGGVRSTILPPKAGGATLAGITGGTKTFTFGKAATGGAVGSLAGGGTRSLSPLAKTGGGTLAGAGGGTKVNQTVKAGGGSAAVTGGGVRATLLPRTGGAALVGVGGNSGKGSGHLGGATLAGSGGGAKMTLAARVGGASAAGVGGAFKLAALTKSGGAYLVGRAGGAKGLGVLAKLGGAITAATGGGARATSVVKASGASGSMSGGASRSVAVTKPGGASSALIGGASKLYSAVKLGGGSAAGVGGGSKWAVSAHTGGGAAAASGGAVKLVRSAKTGGAVVIGVAGGNNDKHHYKTGGAIGSLAGGGFYGTPITRSGGASATAVGGGLGRLVAPKTGGATATLHGGDTTHFVGYSPIVRLPLRFTMRVHRAKVTIKTHRATADVGLVRSDFRIR